MGIIPFLDKLSRKDHPQPNFSLTLAEGTLEIPAPGADGEDQIEFLEDLDPVDDRLVVSACATGHGSNDHHSWDAAEKRFQKYQGFGSGTMEVFSVMYPSGRASCRNAFPK